MKYHFVKKSANSKTGKIPVTYSQRETCPPSCPHYRSDCYAEDFYTRLAWDKVPQRGIDLQSFCGQIAKLPQGQIWRFNVAGDLAGIGESIDTHAMDQIIKANEGKRGFTYTHKTASKSNLNYIKKANAQGFTINLSADDAGHADRLFDTGAGAVVCIVPIDTPAKSKTPAGRQIIVCPAQTRDDVTCQTCKLCAVPDRAAIIGFRAHGTRAKIADARARKVIPIAVEGVKNA
jgi:hypothetical protein